MSTNSGAPKRRRRKENRPDEIIAAAFLELVEKGYAGTSIASVAARSGIARSTVYLYFADKESLIHAVFEARLGAALSDATQTAEYDAPFEQVFATMVRGILRGVVKTDSIHLLRILIGESGRFPELAEFYHRRVISRVEAMVHGIVQRALQRGEVRADALDLDLRVMIAPLIMAAVWRLAFDKVAPLEPDHLADSAVSIICRGLAPLPGP